MDFHTFYHVVQITTCELFAEVDAWFDKPEALQEFKPANGGWNVHQNLEHLWFANFFLLTSINKAKRKALKKAEEVSIEDIFYSVEQLIKLEEIGVHNGFKWRHRANTSPSREGRINLVEVRDTLKEQLAQILDTLDSLQDGQGTLVKTTISVNDIGKLDVYEFIYFLALHSKRHIEQMTKIEQEFNRLVH